MVAQLRAPATGSGVDSINFSRDGDATVEQGLHRFTADRDLTITGVLCSAGTAPTGDDLVFDVMLDAFDGGGTVFTTVANRPTVSAGDNEGAVVVPDVVDVPEGHYLTVDIVSIGSGAPGAKIDVRILYE